MLLIDRGPVPGCRIGFSTIDWDRTSAYCVSDYGQVTVNRTLGKGAARTPQDVWAVRTRLNDMFMSLVDPQSGEALVQNVLQREEIYRGSCIDLAPDVSPVLRDHANYFCQVYQHYARHARPRVIDVASVVDPVASGSVGDHHPHGIFIASGPGIAAGAVLQDASILDMGKPHHHESVRG